MKNFLIAIISFMLLTACNQASISAKNEIQESKKQQPVKEKSVKESATVKHTTARAKSLNFTHAVQQERAQVGKPYEIDISFVGHADTQMTTRFLTTPNLVINSNLNNRVNFNAQGKAQAQRITVTPRTEGIHYVTIYRDGDAKLKPAAIKIIAGNKPEKDYMKTEGTIVEDQNGAKVIEIPAEEG